MVKDRLNLSFFLSTPPLAHIPNFLLGVRCDLDKKKARMGDTLAYFPFGLTIERSQMTYYHKELLVLASLEAHYLILSKETPCTTLKILLCKTCVVYTVELLHCVAEVLEHTTHDTVTA